MRTAWALLLTFAFATGVLMFQLAGVGAMFGVGNPTADLDSGDRFADEADDNILEEGDGESFNPDARGQDNLVGFIISGFSVVFGYVKIAVLLPVEFQNIGAPRWAAYPAGLFIQTLVVIGAAQFGSGRVWS